jgi:exopolyphosphatase/guanosine-5'-triphosphate,3'-diphosphate pyrophosphatase
MLSLREILVPGVGVREGVLESLMREHFAVKPMPRPSARSRELIAKARRFGRRFDYDEAHCEQVRRLAVELFDQLRPLHGMGLEERSVLEVGALLHGIGHFVDSEDHHKHGEYLVRYGRIDSLSGWRRDMLACLVRYHYKAEPLPDHKVYGSLDTDQQRDVRALTSILRIAAGLDSDRRRAVRDVEVAYGRGEVILRVDQAGSSRAPLEEAERRATLFEVEFDVQVRFGTMQRKNRR